MSQYPYPAILHLMTPGRKASPFDVNMAIDGGFEHVVPYGDVTLEEVVPLVQDTIFSRSPKAARYTGIFFGGRDYALACDMLDHAEEAMVPPFKVSCFADPSGGFTTAAALVAVVERRLQEQHATDLHGKRVAIFGGTGPVGVVTAVMLSDLGATPVILSHRSAEAAQEVADEAKRRFELDRIEANVGGSDEDKAERLREADIVLSCAPAGVQVLSKALVDGAPHLLALGDVNAVPPAGIEGVEVTDDARPMGPEGRTLGIGALAVGGVKSKTQRGLFEAMLQAEEPVYLGVRDALERARREVE